MQPAFDDRSLTLKGTPEQLARVAQVLSAPTRLRVLTALIDHGEPLHINELARRVGVDASPVRTHLELLLREGLVVEVQDTDRRRRFTTALTAVELRLEGARRDPLAEEEPGSKEEAKLRKRLRALERKHDRIQDEADEVRRDLAELRPAAPELGRT